VLALCLSAEELSAQNLIANGSFTPPVLTPWVASGPGWTPGLQNFDTDGTGTSQCYAVSPSNSAHVLKQTVTAVPTKLEVTIDLAVTNLPLAISPAMPIVTIFFGKQQIASQTWPFSRLSPKRRRLCAQFQSTAVGQTEFIIQMTWAGNATAGSPRVYIDNVDLRPARSPMFCIRGERQLGGKTSFEVEGTASAAFVVLVAPSVITPIQIPGIQGALELDPTSFAVFVSGALNSSGTFQLGAALPNIPALAGVRLYWQALEASTAGASLGWAYPTAFYN
jgi:hypothetical protein